MLFFLPSHLCWCPLLFTAVLPGDSLVASTAIFALGLYAIQPGSMQTKLSCTAFQCWQVERPSEAPLTQEDACGLCRLTQIMSQASELSRECSRTNSWSTWHFIIWMFLLAGSSVSSRVIIMQEYARQNSKKGSCVAVMSNFLLCSKFVTLLILLYEPGYLSKANIHCLCQKREFAFSFPD